jgi:hypothetical protein
VDLGNAKRIRRLPKILSGRTSPFGWGCALHQYSAQQKLGRIFLCRYLFFFQPSRELGEISETDDFRLGDGNNIIDILIIL